MWVKLPGESDGVSQAGVVDPDDRPKGFDAMRDPTRRNRYNSAFRQRWQALPRIRQWFP